MTVTFPPTGTPTARRSAARRPGARRAVAGAALAAVIVAGMLFGASPADADATPSPTPSGDVALTVAAMGDGVLTPGAPLNIWVTQQNGTGGAVADSTATISLGSEPLVGRAALAAWLSADTGDVADATDAAGAPLDDVAQVAMPAVSAGGHDTSIATVASDAASLQNRPPGVYPLLARIDGAASVTARGVVTVPGTTSGTPVGVVVPITAGPLSEGLLTSDELAALTAADGLLTGTLDAVVGTPAILAIDPAIPAAIRVLGSTAPETATAWLQRLMALPNERFALQFGDADVAAQLASGATAPAQPLSLASSMKVGDFASLPATGSPAPSPTATGEPALPDMKTLLDVGATRGDVYWPLTGTANADVIAKLSSASVDGQTALTLVASDSTDAGAQAAAVPATAKVGESEVLVYDRAASDALRDAAVVPETPLRGAPLAAATAYLALAAQTGGPLLVVVDRANDYGRAGLRAAIVAATQAPGATSADLRQLTIPAPATVSLPAGESDAARTAAAARFTDDENSLRSFSTILDDPDVLLGPERAQMLQLLGAGWQSQPDEWAQAVTAHRTATATTLDSVGILPPTSILLVSPGAGLPFWVRNELPWPITVTLNASPGNLRLEVQNSTEVRVDSASNKRTEVPVQARIGNGDASIALQLTGPDGVPIGQSQTATVNVQPDWEGWGVGILSVLVGGLLVLGLVRTVLHRRWLRRQEAAGDGRDAASAPIPMTGDLSS